MKKIITLIFVVLVAIANAQIHNPVKWKTAVEKISDNEYYLVATASIEAGWKLYAQNIPPKGPIPTSFAFEKSANFELMGKTEESKPIQKHDKVFDMEIAYFHNQAVFKQRIKIVKPITSIKATVEFMSCDDSNCLPPDTVDLEFFLSGAPVASKVATPQFTFGNNTVPTTTVSQTTTTKAPNTTPISRQGLWTIFFISFLSGFAALLTPCVFPMIPMTVSFFLKRSGENKAKARQDAVLYGLGIIIIYVMLGLLITLIFGPNALNSLSTNAIFNVFLFALLVVFAISFFGAFEITLPASWSSKMDAKASSTTGFISIFFMSFVLVIVSFSCTGPIIGFLLVNVTSGGLWAPLLGMLGFSIALAIPFGFFALFPTLLKALPKSGGWLNTVKVVLAFIELAFALKFLSVADLAYGWGILDREVFIVLWIIIFAMLGFYLLGKLRFPHDDKEETVSIPKFFMAVISFAFAIYMIPGLWGAPLKAVSAFSPPMHTQDFSLYKNHLEAHYSDYELGMAAAKVQKKPVVVDFSGFGCVNCRKMEAAVWTDDKVFDKLTNDFILISLMVDDKTPLPEPIEVEENGATRKLRTLGDKYSYIQRHRFGANAQPFYVILDENGDPMTGSYAFSESVEDFLKFLDAGMSNYKAKK